MIGEIWGRVWRGFRDGEGEGVVVWWCSGVRRLRGVG